METDYTNRALLTPAHKAEESAQIQRDIARYLQKGGKITELPYTMKSNVSDIPLTDRQKMRLESLADPKRKRLTMEQEAKKRGAAK